MKTHQSIERAQAFAARLNLQVPVLLAPMAGACPPALSIAVANAGGMGACGALLMTPDQIRDWVRAVRLGSNGSFQLNTWIPDPEPIRDAAHEALVAAFLSPWERHMQQGEVDHGSKRLTGTVQPPVFAEQCDAMIDAAPVAVSSIMGIYPADVVSRMKQRGILWFATATTVSEALRAAEAGADVIVAQGMEAGGHRGAFFGAEAERSLVGLFSLLPAVVDAVDVPVVATGGIADARGAAAALLLGASAVQVGTGFLRASEASLSAAWADAIAAAAPEDTVATRAFSGRLGRSIRTRYVDAMDADDAPRPAPYPIQRELTAQMRQAATASNNIDGLQAWAGQSARLAQACPAAQIVDQLWRGVCDLLSR